MHDISDVYLGGPESVDRCFLSPSTSVMRVVLWNMSLPPPVSCYTLTFNINYELAKYPKNNPEWFEDLNNSVM